MKNPLDECLRKFVVVEAAGIRYMGTLIEVGDEEIILKTKNRWISVQMDKVTYVKPVDEAKLDEVKVEDVDADEFTPAGDEEE